MDEFADLAERVGSAIGRTVLALNACCKAIERGLRRALAAVRRWVWASPEMGRASFLGYPVVFSQTFPTVLIIDSFSTAADRERFRRAWLELQGMPKASAPVEDLTTDQLRASLGGDGASLAPMGRVRFDAEGGFHQCS